VPWAIGIFLFFCAAFIAYRRAAPAAQDVPRRRRRILLTGLTWATMFALMFAPQQYAKPWGSPFWLSLLLVTAVLFLLGTTILGGLDLILDYFRPLRRREWLAIGPLLFAVIVPATIFGLGLGPSGGLLAQAGPGPVALAAAAAGLVWWAWLPALDASLAYVFE
jgi:succinate dehydrogenase hydrophobic anchor subunit